MQRCLLTGGWKAIAVRRGNTLVLPKKAMRFTKNSKTPGLNYQMLSKLLRSPINNPPNKNQKNETSHQHQLPRQNHPH